MNSWQLSARSLQPEYRVKAGHRAVSMSDARSETFTLGLVGAVLLLGLASAALFLPIARCGESVPHIFEISTNVTVPGAPITDPYPVVCWCGGSGRISLFDRWRVRRWRSCLVY